MKDAISPEEKLLRLIRGQRSPEKPLPAEPALAKPKVNLQVAQWKREVYSFAPKFLRSLNIQKWLIIIFMLSCAYLAAAVAYPLFIPKKPPLPKIAAKNIPEEKMFLEESAKPYEFYSGPIKEKQIFGSLGLQAGGGDAPIALGNELIKDINLVGILSGDNPQAVIEDKKAQKTYYVTKGQFVGQFQLEDIREGKIILGSGGQKYELYL